MYQIVIHIPLGGNRTLIAELFFKLSYFSCLSAFPLFLSSLSFLICNYLSLFLKLGEGLGDQSLSLRTRYGGDGGAFVLRKALQSPTFQPSLFFATPQS